MKNDNVFSEAARLRREAGQKSVEVFAQLFLPHYLKKKSCAFHKELYAMLSEMTLQRGERLAIAAPRGNAKSAIVSTIYALWCICYKKDDYIVLISDTRDQAENHLSHVKSELEENERLMESFPEICEMGQKPMPPRWTRSEIITRNGIKITALGSGQKIRGRRSREIRPSLIILDDIENDENTQSEESREKLFDWFSKAVLKAGSERTNVVVIGTIQHYDSLLAKLTGEDAIPGWRSRIYKSVISWAANQDLWQRWVAIFNNRDSYRDVTGKNAAREFFVDNEMSMLEGTSVLWPEMEDYYALMVLREQGLVNSFDSEKQNDPVSSIDCLFNPAEFRYYNDTWHSTEELLQWLGNNAQFFGSCDPSSGNYSDKGDYSAIIVLARDKRDGTLYAIEADIKRRKPNVTVDDILAYCNRYKFVKFGCEGNYFQDVMIRDMDKRAKADCIYTEFLSIKSTSNKRERIQSLQPLVKNGTIVFNKAHTMLIDQLRYFPKGKYDDAPDALHMAVELCSKPVDEFSFGFAGGGSLRSKTTEEIMKEAETLPADGLVPHGWWGWHRRG